MSIYQIVAIKEIIIVLNEFMDSQSKLALIGSSRIFKDIRGFSIERFLRTSLLLNSWYINTPTIFSVIIDDYVDINNYKNIVEVKYINNTPEALVHISSLRSTITNVHYVYNKCYNHKVKLPDRITHLSYDTTSFFPLENVIPNSVLYLTICDEYNWDTIGGLPKSAIEITLGNAYNRPIDVSNHNNLKIIRFGNFFNQEINDRLPISLEELVLSGRFNKSVDLTKLVNLKLIRFSDNFNHNIDESLPVSIEEIVFGENFNKPINLSRYVNLKKIKFGKGFTYDIDDWVIDREILVSFDAYQNYDDIDM